MDDRPAFNPLRYPITFENPRWVTGSSAWVTHIPFAMALVDMLRPDNVVELGTLAGDSYCAFCQAVDTLKLEDARSFAIDTWQGDKHSGEVDQETLAALREHHDPLYGKFSMLVQ